MELVNLTSKIAKNALVNYTYAHRTERSFDSPQILFRLESFPEIYNNLNSDSVISATEKLVASKTPNNGTRQKSDLENNLYAVTWNLQKK
jgi:hypothetical protein